MTKIIPIGDYKKSQGHLEHSHYPDIYPDKISDKTRINVIFKYFG